MHSTSNINAFLDHQVFGLSLKTFPPFLNFIGNWGTPKKGRHAPCQFTHKGLKSWWKITYSAEWQQAEILTALMKMENFPSVQSSSECNVCVNSLETLLKADSGAVGLHGARDSAFLTSSHWCWWAHRQHSEQRDLGPWVFSVKDARPPVSTGHPWIRVCLPSLAPKLNAS